MKSNECVLIGTRRDIEKALKEVEKVAEYNKLATKEALQLRLLAEEMMGMQKGILGFVSGKFYLENKHRTYNIYLHTDIEVDSPAKEKFVEMASNQKNAAYSGFMGKIRKIADEMSSDATQGCYYEGGYSADPMMFTHPVINYDKIWALSQYREQAKKEIAQWDELEKSIVASIADEFIVGARNKYIDLIAVKKF